MKQQQAVDSFLTGRRVVLVKFVAQRYKEVSNKAKKVVGIVNLYEVQCADGKAPTVQVWWEASFDSGRRCYEKFMRTEMRGVSYFYALEQNPGRDGCHVHALWCDCKNMRRTEIWDKWFHRYGRARIEPVNIPRASRLKVDAERVGVAYRDE